MTMSNENVTELVERLFAQGLINRRASATDGRFQLINLTTEGCKIFRAMARENGEWVSEILASLSSCEIDELTQLPQGQVFSRISGGALA